VTTFITLTATDTTTSELATTSAFVPADLFPCVTSEDCDAFIQLCDAVRCGCINRNCEQLTGTTTAEPTTTTTAAPEENTTTAAVEEPATTTQAEEVATTQPPARRRAVSVPVPEGAHYCDVTEDCGEKIDIDGFSCEVFGCTCLENSCVAEVPNL
jgi:hypothetical protein